ncbi:hypothetical protein V8D89_000141 [Ganoderma adspersum]
MAVSVPEKVPLLVAMVAASFKGVYCSPTPPPRVEEQKKYGEEDIIDRFVRLRVPVAQCVTVFFASCEITSLLAPHLPARLSDPLLSLLLPRGASALGNIATVTPSFLVGWGLAVSGALLHMWCYRVLGPQYTFQRAVIKEHKLVTSGPYRVVRHPAYTGFTMYMAGLLTVQLCPGSWARESGILDGRRGKAVMVAWAVYAGNLSLAVVKRCEFSGQWVTWSKITTTRLIPWIW